MALSTQPYKGTRDFYPEDMRLRNWIFAKWREVCESFGYEEYDGPILEPLELFTSKTSDEIVNEQTYSFTDRGDRRVVMRPEMTPTVSRMVAARRQELGYPLRLYSIPNCFRYERPQKGRLREFWQLNADIFGVEGIEADVEIIKLADAVMKSFGATQNMYTIAIGSRTLLNQVCKKYGVADPKEFIRIVDAKEKMPRNEFEEAISSLIKDKDNLETVLYILDLKSLEGLRSGLDLESLNNVREAMLKLEGELVQGSKTNIIFNPSIARGFDYYTDIVFEVFDANPENNRSMFGGGRYDGLVGEFGVEPVPTVGFGMGDATLLEFLKSNNLLPKLQPATDLVVVLVGDVADKAAKVISRLREGGVNAAVDYTGRKLEKQIKAADKQGVRYVMFVGEKELQSEQFKLKNIQTGEEENHGLERIVSIVKDYRKK